MYLLAPFLVLCARSLVTVTSQIEVRLDDLAEKLAPNLLSFVTSNRAYDPFIYIISQKCTNILETGGCTHHPDGGVDS